MPDIKHSLARLQLNLFWFLILFQLLSHFSRLFEASFSEPAGTQNHILFRFNCEYYSGLLLVLTESSPCGMMELRMSA
jgi:hypothetical protein